MKTTARGNMKKVFVILICFAMLWGVNTVSATNATIEQVVNSSYVVKTHIEINYTIPGNTNVGENQVSMSQYLQLSTIAVLNINNSSNASIPITTCNTPHILQKPFQIEILIKQNI